MPLIPHNKKPHLALDTFHRLLGEMMARDARKLFLIPGEPPSLRSAEGGIERLDEAPLDDAALRAIGEAVAGDAIGRLGEHSSEVTRWYDLPGTVCARCTFARSAGHLTVVAASVETVAPSPEQVGMPPELVAAVERGHGLVIFAGLPGSGKTTSLLSVVEHMNLTRACHICTVEAPIEVRLEPKRALIQQRQVGLDAPNTIGAIHASMRQDPDLIFVSEVQDAEEVQACVTAAASGHVIILQMMASSVEEAITRLIDCYPQEMRAGARRGIAGVLRAISVQRLLPAAVDGRRWVAAHEVLVVDNHTRAALLKDDTLPRRSELLSEGLWTMDEAMESLLEAGEITAETLTRARENQRGRLVAE